MKALKLTTFFSVLIGTILSITACNQQSYQDETKLAETKQVKNKHDYTNVVLILIDDLNHYGVTAYGANRLHSYDGEFTNRVFSTPNIDTLAKGGLRVDHAFAYPICENTRIALMSGKRNDRNYLQPKSQHESDITFGDAFQKAGYATGLFGKWKQTRGTKEVPGKDYISQFGWDEYAAFDVVTEGQRFINPNLVINGVVHNYNNRTDVDPHTNRRWYGPDIVNRHALEFIDKNKEKPFFLYYPMILVHDDHKPTPNTQPHSIFDEFPENADYNNTRGDDRYYFPDMIEYMDTLVGKVRDKLEENGLLENTLIVIMGDNGTKETFGHILADGTIYPGRKGGNADNGIHVPLILHMPKNIPNAIDMSTNVLNGYRTYQGLVNLTDIYPTIAEAAGIDMPDADQIDGISFWQQAIGASEKVPRDYIYTWYIGNNTYKDEDLFLRYAFTKDFKRYAPDKDFPNGRFFDLRSDPLERVGDRVVKKKWKLLRYSGLNLAQLDEQQKSAYLQLGQILDNHKLVRVESLAIEAPKTTLSVGETISIDAVVLPKTAQRQGIVWESSDPSIASINKFGELSAHRAGKVQISIFSWDDAQPLSANKAQTFVRNGLVAHQQFEVLP
jgi:arylsulfatase A-like enzyme